MELTSRHHDEGTLTLRKYKDLLSGKNTRPTVATNTCLPITTWAGLLISTHEGYKSRLGRDCLCLLIGRTRVTNQSLSCDRLTYWEDLSMDFATGSALKEHQLWSNPGRNGIWQAGADTNRCTPASQLNWLRLSLDLQVLVPAVPLSGLTALTAYASFTGTFNRNLMAAWLVR